MGNPSFAVNGGPTPSYDHSSSDSEKNRPALLRKTSSFFPWSVPGDENTKFTFRKLTRFPVLGAAGVFGSLCTIALSAMTLHFFDRMPVEERVFKLLPKPAAFLSIILSLNTLMVHLAISQGMAVSWWVRASHKHATVKDMHNTWAAGSIVEALLAWKAFNYVALATVIVATLPVNGVLLQNALTSIRATIDQQPEFINYNFANRLPVNWTSATLNHDLTVAVYDNKFSTIISDTVARNFSDPVITRSKLTTCNGTCYADLAGLGFKTTCSETRVPYNIPTFDQWTSAWKNDDPSADYLVMSVDVIWSVFNPNIIGVNVLEKINATCIGEFLVTNCTLEMGEEYYSTKVDFNATGSNTTTHSWKHDNGIYDYGFNGWGLDWSSDIKMFTPYPVIPEVGLGKIANETKLYNLSILDDHTTRFGGIANALQSYYNSSVTINMAPDPRYENILNANLVVNGQFAKQRTPYAGDWGDNGISYALPYCDNVSFDYGTDDLPYNSTADDVLSGIKSTFFFASIMLADTMFVDEDRIITNETYNWDVVQKNTDSTQIRAAVIYTVRWKWWCASLGVTIGVILFVLPTFWGFWMLSRRTTLSPFETARAFHAPVIQDAPPHLNTKQLLKTVGDKNLHTDLVHSPIFVASPQAIHHGYHAPVGYFPDQQVPTSQYPPQQYPAQQYRPQQSVPQPSTNPQSPPPQYPPRKPVSQQFSSPQSSPPQSPPQQNYDMHIQPLPPQGYTPMPYPGDQHQGPR